MEFPFPTSRCSVSRPSSLCPCLSRCYFANYFFGRRKLRRRLNCSFKPLQIKLSLEKHSSSDENPNRYNQEGNGNSWGDSEFVEVVGIGSRKDAVFDFCLSSPFCSSTLRFWNILTNDSGKLLLQQKCAGKEGDPRIVEASLAWNSCPKATILVASAAYGSDHITAIDILKSTKFANGLSVAIILTPFSFEGRRRQDEVKVLLGKLQEHTNFCIVVDTDSLLKKDLVTLDEALKTANNAVLMAINSIFVLVFDGYKKLLDVPDISIKELKMPEVIKILEGYKDAEIGFGCGCDIKTAIVRAIYDCPFLSLVVKDFNGVVICILASSKSITSSEVEAFSQTFRQITDCLGKIIISTVLEPNLEPNQIVATVIAVGYPGKEASSERSIFSKLALHFPFIFSLLSGQKKSENDDNQENCSPDILPLPKVINSADSGEMPNIIPLEGTAESFNTHSAEIQTLLNKYGDEIHALRDDINYCEQSDIEYSEFSSDSSTLYESDSEGSHAFRREPLFRRDLGPGYQLQKDWTSDLTANPVIHNQSIYKLPVGVRSSKEAIDGLVIPNIMKPPEQLTEEDSNGPPVTTQNMSLNPKPDGSVEAVKDFYNNASSLLKGNSVNNSKKQGVLSVRAASMLEAERDSQRKWSPNLEMKYRGGIYRGRCQGGLPEGKGCLSLGDGSSYDGMWRYGKRWGLGTFNFSNGDVFQGSWRDDLMHGKGWFYFHTGDRWFANFWKGKANGEGRFYSKLGDIFFGHFKDGWRHGHFLCINVNGERCLEIWDEGFLVSREELDSDTGSG